MASRPSLNDGQTNPSLEPPGLRGDRKIPLIKNSLKLQIDTNPFSR